ncbi:MAG: S26 family signal peptidase [Actinomycetes bacterium]
MDTLHFSVAKLFKAVELRGDSMSPNYNDGDWLLFRLLPAKSKSGLNPKALVGKVVLIQRQSQVGKDFLQVKRVNQISSKPNTGNKKEVWVEGDNKAKSTDSRSWGAIDSSEVIGKLILRYRRAKF